MAIKIHYALSLIAFDKGQVVTPNKMAAMTFYAFAGELGDPQSALLVAHRYKNGTNVKRDMDSYLQWLMKAADSGSYEATIELARLKSPNSSGSCFAYVVAGLTLGIIVS